MKLNYKQIGLKKDNLYEVLATTYNITQDKIIPNTACMGIRLIKEDVIKMSPYRNTRTYKNLKLNKYITLNFVENIYLYALAALKEANSKIGLYSFPEYLYSFLEIDKKEEIKEISNEMGKIEKIYIPFINEAWVVIICKVGNEEKISKENDLGRSILSEFELNIIKIMKFKDSFKLFNRTENIALESIILATRLKIAYIKKDQLQFSKILEIIEKKLENARKFGKNLNALKSIDLVEKYIKCLKI
jgi:hypothetical protein